MGQTRRLPEDSKQRLDRLSRDNWRTQVSTAPVISGAVTPVAVPGEAVSWAEVLERLAAAEERLDNLEGVEGSG